MISIRTSCMVACCLSVSLLGSAIAQDVGNRKELKRVDLSGAPGMEVIASISEFKPGDVVGRHFHHGVESGYFVQGGMIEPLGKDPIKIPSGAPVMNERGVPHAGFKVVGESPIRIYTVHIVDKGKPLYEWVSKN